MSAPILFVVNPVSGNSNKAPIIREIWNWSTEKGKEISIWKTTGSDDKANLSQQIQQYKPETIVAVGGDGTLKLCAELLKDSEVNLGLVPAGSANGMAKELGVPVNTQRALQYIEESHIKRIDLLEFNGEELGMHISDLGLNASMVQQIQHSGFMGFLNYASRLVQKLRALDSFQVKISSGDQTQSFDAFMVAIANAKRYGTGALLNAKGKIDDGQFEICILKDFDFIDIGKHFFDQVGEESPHMTVIQCDEARIEVQNDRKIPFQIDGESKENVKEVRVKILPQCLNIIVPEN